jgi:non-specific serine/threonine protein kinase
VGVPGETVWRLPPLALPDLAQGPNVKSVGQIEAVQLFLDRARSAQPSFVLDEHNAQAVAEVCVRLDGIPLAIELAAVRVKLLTPTDLARRLNEPLRVLTHGGRTAPARQQTLRATLEWSYGLLPEAERRLLARLSVFAGGWTLSAAETVCAGGPIGGELVLELLAQLVDKSLVVVDDHLETARYRMLAPVRHYAAERLDEAGTVATVRDHHRAWYLQLVDQAEPEWFGPRQAIWSARLEQEHDNLRAALAWSLTGRGEAGNGLRLGAGLWRFWDMRGYLTEGSDYLRGLLALAPSVPVSRARARALTVAGYLATLRGDHAEARQRLDEAVAAWQALADDGGLAAAVFYLGLLAAWSRADIQAADSYLTRSLALARRAPTSWVTYFSLMRLADLARLRGDAARAQALLDESRALTEAVGDGWSRGRCLHSLGLVKLACGDYAQARRLLCESLSLAIGLQDRRGIVYALEGLGSVAIAEGQADRAARLLGRAEALRGSMGSVVSAVFDAGRELGIRTVREQLGEAAFERAWSSGGELSLEEVAGPLPASGGELAEVP